MLYPYSSSASNPRRWRPTYENIQCFPKREVLYHHKSTSPRPRSSRQTVSRYHPRSRDRKRTGEAQGPESEDIPMWVLHHKMVITRLNSEDMLPAVQPSMDFDQDADRFFGYSRPIRLTEAVAVLGLVEVSPARSSTFFVGFWVFLFF